MQILITDSGKVTTVIKMLAQQTLQMLCDRFSTTKELCLVKNGFLSVNYLLMQLGIMNETSILPGRFTVEIVDLGIRREGGRLSLNTLLSFSSNLQPLPL